MLVLDEPTNHLDLESIEALVAALRAYDGTLIFVSHDRWFVSQLATRVVEIKPGEVTDYLGTYEEYVHASGDDHLDADTVLLRARREKRRKARERRGTGNDGDDGTSSDRPSPDDLAKEIRRLQRERDEITKTIEVHEARLASIDASFCEDGFYERTPPDEVTNLENERADAGSSLESCLLYTSPSPRDRSLSRMPSSA